MELKNVVIVDGARSAFTRGGRGKLVATRLDEAAATVVRTLMERNPKVKPEMVEDVGLGNVMGAGELTLIGANAVARLAGLPSEVCSFDSNRQCGSSMETLHRVAQSIMVGATDCGTVVHPMSLATQMRGGAVMGFGMAGKEQPVYDPQNGLPANVSLYQCKPPSYLDVPPVMEVAALDKPDPDNPMGIKGAGEPPMGAAASALLCAISDALGGHYFNRTPVVTDMIINAAAGRPQSHKPLAVNTQ